MPYNQDIDYLALLSDFLGPDYVVLKTVITTTEGRKIKIEVNQKDYGLSHIPGRIHMHNYVSYIDLPMQKWPDNVNEFAFKLISRYMQSSFLVVTTAAVMNVLEKRCDEKGA